MSPNRTKHCVYLYVYVYVYVYVFIYTVRFNDFRTTSLNICFMPKFYDSASLPGHFYTLCSLCLFSKKICMQLTVVCVSANNKFSFIFSCLELKQSCKNIFLSTGDGNL